MQGQPNHVRSNEAPSAPGIRAGTQHLASVF
jgi:hypothetical protein